MCESLLVFRLECAENGSCAIIDSDGIVVFLEFCDESLLFCCCCCEDDDANGGGGISVYLGGGISFSFDLGGEHKRIPLGDNNEVDDVDVVDGGGGGITFNFDGVDDVVDVGVGGGEMSLSFSDGGGISVPLAGDGGGGGGGGMSLFFLSLPIFSFSKYLGRKK